MRSIVSLTLISLVAVFACGAYGMGCVDVDGTTCCGLRIALFGKDIAIQFALDQGYFEDEGVTPCFPRVPGSAFMYQNFEQGNYDMVKNIVDNILWRRLHLNASYSLITGTDGCAGFKLLGNRNNGIHSLEDLEGKPILVDSKDSGFVLGIKKIFHDENIPLPDNLLVPAGGTARYQALIDGTYQGMPAYATMANIPTTLEYPDHVVELADQSDYICPIQGNGHVAMPSWLRNETNFEMAVRYLKALVRGYRFAAARRNKGYVVGKLRSENGYSLSLALRMYDALIKNQNTGMNVDQVPRKRGLENLILARTVGLGLSPYPQQALDEFLRPRPGGFVDLSPLDEAFRRLGLGSAYSAYNNASRTPCERRRCFDRD